MKKALLQVITCLTFTLAMGHAQAQDAADSAAEAAGGHLGAVYMLHAVKKTQCGYALLLDVEDLSRKVEQDVLRTLPPKYRKDVLGGISTLKQQSPSDVAKYIKDLEGKFDDKTRCGLVVGMYIGIHIEFVKAWERAKKTL